MELLTPKITPTIFGHHWLVELYGCPADLLSDLERVEEIMRGAAIHSNTTIVNALFHKFLPHGISGFVVITESHLAIHTWPEHNYAAVDLFTCGHNAKMQLAHDYLVREFRPKEHIKTEILRGTDISRVPSVNATLRDQDLP